MLRDRILREVESAADELVEFAADLVRVPTVNPPGEAYPDCARLLGDRLLSQGFEIEYLEATGCPEHTPAHPRVNVVGHRRGARARPRLHLNGHIDVVPPGEGWTVDPFAGIVRDARLYGRGSADMKGGIAAAVFAAEAIRRAGVRLEGSLEISGTVDEESGGAAGVAWLARSGRLSGATTDYVIIPEPLDVDRVCIGHRGVYWFEVSTLGRVAHGSMPFLGVSAIDQMGHLLEAFRTEVVSGFAERRTRMPVVPDAARHPTLNVNGIDGGQPVTTVSRTPCVADRCRAVFDRRFLVEEGFEHTRAEVVELLERLRRRVPDFRCELADLMVVHPVCTPDPSPLVSVLRREIRNLLDRDATLVASPGTYDHKHVAGIAGIEQCVAYGPGQLELAHQPDESCAVEDLVNATKVLAMAILELVGER